MIQIPTPTLYELLGVSPTASAPEIKSAWRDAARRLHPDAGGNPALFDQVRMAYETLSNPKRREAYDATLTGRPYDSEASGFSRGTGTTSSANGATYSQVPVRRAQRFLAALVLLSIADARIPEKIAPQHDFAVVACQFFAWWLLVLPGAFVTRYLWHRFVTYSGVPAWLKRGTVLGAGVVAYFGNVLGYGALGALGVLGLAILVYAVRAPGARTAWRQAEAAQHQYAQEKWETWRRARWSAPPTPPPPTGTLRMHLNADGSEKRKYASFDEARSVAERQMAQEGDGRALNTYLCPCGSWHNGHGTAQ